MDKRVNEIIESLNKAVVDDISIYSMKDLTPFYDYSVIASANTTRQAIAAIEYVRDDEEKRGHTVRNTKYDPNSTWLLLDLNDVVVHVFVGEDRLRYNLDNMYLKGRIE